MNEPNRSICEAVGYLAASLMFGEPLSPRNHQTVWSVLAYGPPMNEREKDVLMTIAGLYDRRFGSDFSEAFSH